MAESFNNQETCKAYFENAYGYVIFELITNSWNCFEGDVCILNNEDTNNNDNKYGKVGTSKMLQASIGPQLGGQVYKMIIFFETERDYQHFISTDNFEFGVDAKVVASISNTLQYMKGMAIFTSTIGGLMYEATLSGQKYNFTPTTGNINDEDEDP
ncbi:hypothetical protein FRACYDRAFT_235168 [Fragilariopsis cylindrus CCMP1102]|uniref:Ysc84 actin-binding domain-containing protein n=1 Tax=Fragilariopsis cylindrus CCMP1102 TaxID=635003 RepID=A0A1E7FTU4_9STRA|nr:hypothetical protein FRACYDRAFT_235168 [Fragilariopsis cylindrus CCMP1102]|eukprot:OEU21544.1 hypothetical protein FRACYDRAFT_235168 [Fragilariopsis cylindrus CCMP1102]